MSPVSYFVESEVNIPYIVNIGAIEPRKNQELNTSQNNASLPLKIMLRDVEWSRNKCCWPIGDPKLPGFSFCGTSIIPGRPYCEETFKSSIY